MSLIKPERIVQRVLDNEEEKEPLSHVGDKRRSSDASLVGPEASKRSRQDIDVSNKDVSDQRSYGPQMIRSSVQPK